MFRLKPIVEWLGIDVRRHTRHETFLQRRGIKKLVHPNTMLSKKALLNILESIDHTKRENIQGAFVECGVWKGGAVALAAMYLESLADFSMDLHLFDSFGEICEPDANVDGKRAVLEARGIENAKGRLVSSGIYERMGISTGQVDQVRDLIEKKVAYQKGKVELHEGWFQETMPKCTSIKEIAVLRLDGDWYSSTKCCLDHLYEKVSPRGVVIIDDYYAYEGCRKAVDEFLINRGEFVRFRTINSEAIWWLKSEVELE